MSGVNFVDVLPFSWRKRETHKQNAQELSGKGRDSPGKSRDNPVKFMFQARERHININVFVRLVLRRPRVCPGDFTGFVPGTNPVNIWDKPGFSSLFYAVEARFHRVCPRDKPGLSLGQSRGRRAAQTVYVKKVYVPFSLANVYVFSCLQFLFRP